MSSIVNSEKVPPVGRWESLYCMYIAMGETLAGLYDGMRSMSERLASVSVFAGPPAETSRPLFLSSQRRSCIAFRSLAFS